MKTTNIKLDITQRAVLAAAAYVSLSADGEDRIGRIVRATNVFLEKNGHDIVDRSVVEQIVNQMVGGAVLSVKENIISVPLMNTAKRNPKNLSELVAVRRLPKNIILRSKVLNKNGIDYCITFNNDGRGGIKLADGSKCETNLQQLSDQLVAQHSLRDTEGKGGYMRWIEVTTGQQFDKWMNNNYPITE